MRVRDRHPNTVRRYSDPVGSGYYVFCGVRWLDPDTPTDARLLADGLARLEADFPHLRGATTIHQLRTVIRQKRSIWKQHLLRRSTYGERKSEAVDRTIRLGAAAQEIPWTGVEYPAGDDFNFLMEDAPSQLRCQPDLLEANTLHSSAATICNPGGCWLEACPKCSPAKTGGPPLPAPLHPAYHCGGTLPATEPPLSNRVPGPLPAVCATSWDAPARPPFMLSDDFGPPAAPWARHPPALPPTPAPAAVAPPAEWPSSRPRGTCLQAGAAGLGQVRQDLQVGAGALLPAAPDRSATAAPRSGDHPLS
jgi:hypothetical protein